MIKTVTKITLLLLFLGILFAAGSNTGYWLEIAPDARAVGMGGTQVGIADTIYAPYWNPAGLAGKKGLAFSNASVYGLANDIYVGIADSSEWGTFGLTAMMLSVGGIQSATYTNGRPVYSGYDVDMKNMLFMLTYAQQLGCLSLGMNLKYLASQIAMSKANGIGFDLGAKLTMGNLSIGGVVYNPVPLTLKWDTGTQETYEMKAKIGLGYKVIDGLLLAVDYPISGYQDGTVSYGGEYTIFNMISLRGGLSKDAQNAGIGFKILGANIDASYTAQTGDSTVFDSSYRFSATYEW